MYSSLVEPFDPTQRGEIVRCATDEPFSRENLANRIGPLAFDLEVTSGATQFVVSYRTDRVAGEPGVGIARVFVPDSPRSRPRPIVVVAHGTTGLADRCAPSALPVVDDSAHLALPWVGAGFITVMPDYAGLGNAGVHGYGNNEDTAHSILDAARAARFALTPGSYDDTVILAGHSQGGGGVLAAQAIARSYSPELQVRAVISIAGVLIDRSLLQAARFPDAPIEEASGLGRAILSLSLYADAANSLGLDRADAPFHPDLRDHVTNAVETLCLAELATELARARGDYVPPLTLGALLDPDFRTDVVRCAANQAPCEFGAYVDRVESNRVTPDPSGAPVLFLSGDDDYLQAPQRQKCLIDQFAPVETSSCLHPARDHATIVPAGAAYAIEWAVSRIEGEAAPTCTSTLSYPECGL